MGPIEIVITETNEGFQSRVLDFIKFSIGWNQRIEDNPLAPPDFTEFEQHNELLATEIWFLGAPDGTCLSIIDQASVFFDNNEISFRTVL